MWMPTPGYGVAIETLRRLPSQILTRCATGAGGGPGRCSDRAAEKFDAAIAIYRRVDAGRNGSNASTPRVRPLDFRMLSKI